MAAYLLGFAANAYSPSHIGRYAIPIPRLIPIVGQNKNAVPSSPLAQTAQSGHSLVINNVPGISSNNPVFTHQSIITTYFWVGEKSSADNGGIANIASAWDENWQTSYGGEDTPKARSGFYPAGFIPKENPFYFALPYTDFDASGHRRANAVNCPLVKPQSRYSWCKNSWIAIRHNGKVAYAQWQDVGPFYEDDSAYVFGSAAPKNKENAKAGLDVSPAVRDFLGLSDVDNTDWVFVAPSSVPAGPWHNIITSNLGTATIN